MRTGRSSVPVPLSSSWASIFRSALSIELLKARSRSSSTSSLSPPPPQEASATAAKSMRNARRRIAAQTSWREAQLDAVGRLDNWMGYMRRSLALAALAAALSAAPAHAGELIVVDGERAVRTNDRAVPDPREVAPEPARVAAWAGAGARARSAERAIAAAPKRPPAGARAVARALRRELAPQAHHAHRGAPLAALAHSRAPGRAQAARRAAGTARLRARLARGARTPTAADRDPHARGLPPTRAQPPVLAKAAVPGPARPGELQGQPRSSSRTSRAMGSRSTR